MGSPLPSASSVWVFISGATCPEGRTQALASEPDFPLHRGFSVEILALLIFSLQVRGPGAIEALLSPHLVPLCHCSAHTWSDCGECPPWGLDISRHGGELSPLLSVGTVGSPGQPRRGWEAKVMGRPEAYFHATASSTLSPYSHLALCTIVFCPWHVFRILLTAILEHCKT